jgi:hypothetical protein
MINLEKFINNILLEWSLRSDSGMPDLDDSGVNALYSSLISNGLNEELSYGITSLIAEKGKYPERQAYNKNGLLVTFPTPEYKARAIAKGTHFEKNPKVGQSNLFGGGQNAPDKSSPPGTTPEVPPSSGSDSSELPKSDSSPDGTDGDSSATTGDTPNQSSDKTSGGPVASTTSSEPKSPPAPETTSKEPANVVQPKPTPQVVQKTPQEIAAEKEVVKQILNTDDTLPVVAGVGGSGITEELKVLSDIANTLNFKESVSFLNKVLKNEK